MNIDAFRFGRRAGVDLQAVEALVKPGDDEAIDSRRLSNDFDELVARRVAFLTDYQSARYAEHYRRWVERARAAETDRTPGKTGFADAVARYLFKLMAYKDEYEVARLYTGQSFRKQVKAAFAGDDLRFEFHLAPPLFARLDPVTGEPKKMSFGPWMLNVFAALAKFKVLRGTPFDPFGYTAERRSERKLILDYQNLLSELTQNLTAGYHHLAVGLAAIPDKIRGFGPVKQRHLAAAKAEEATLREQFRTGAASFLKAAE
jgi:indolepyruvate ferredoxin oxidoreductase